MSLSKGWFKARVLYVPPVIQYVYGWSDKGDECESDGVRSVPENEWGVSGVGSISITIRG